MLKHIVMFKLKDVAEGATKQENARRVKSMLEGLRAKIEDIRHIEVGINVVEGADACDVVLYSEFEDLKGLRTYQSHPEHVRVAEFIGKIRSERRVVDYED